MSEHPSPFAIESFLNLWEALWQAGKRQLFQAWLIESWAVSQQPIPNLQQRDLTSGVAASPDVGDVPNALPGATCHDHKQIIKECRQAFIEESVSKLTDPSSPCEKAGLCITTARSFSTLDIQRRGAALSWICAHSAFLWTNLRSLDVIQHVFTW